MLVSDIITCESNSITSEDFTVVHFADIHMGMPQRLDVSEETQDEKENVLQRRFLPQIN